MPTGRVGYVRYEELTRLDDVLSDMHRRKIIRNTTAVSIYARLKRQDHAVKPGTYRVRPGLTVEGLLRALKQPVRQMVRIPEGWWIARVAKRLEENEVCSADEYIRLAARPQEFQNEVSFQLPKDGTLEGYLFPDTYDLPPLVGARETIKRQLKAFEQKVLPELPENADLSRILTVGSMVELEVAADDERPIVAGVIENRLRINMPLQIDATVLYALQEWKVLGPGEVRRVRSPYNTYRINGLPPGPIGSPGLKSILAAASPKTTEYLYYVARPNKTHMFATTYQEHLKNIQTRKKLLAEEGGSS